MTLLEMESNIAKMTVPELLDLMHRIMEEVELRLMEVAE